MNARVEKQGAEVILVHGLWFGAWSLAPLARRIGQSGMLTRRFRYRSTRGSLDDHADELRRFACESTCKQQHFVGHSLGGLVILRMLSRHAGIAPGRVVLLGSPLQGSRIARKAGRLPGASALIGSMRGVLGEGFAKSPGARETGMIAGSRSVGLGWLLGGLGGPGDGTVAVEETRAGGLADHCVHRVTHTGMLYSPQIAEQAIRFLEIGSFKRSTL